MQPYVHECAEIGDVGHDAGQLHTRFQVFDGMDVVGEGKVRGLLPGVESWLGELLEYVVDGRKACIGGHEVSCMYFRAEFRVSYEFSCADSQGRGHSVHDSVGFGMHGRVVKRIFGSAYPQEAGALLEGLGSEARHVHQFGAAEESAFLLSGGHDVLRERGSDSGYIRKQPG